MRDPQGQIRQASVAARQNKNIGNESREKRPSVRVPIHPVCVSFVGSFSEKGWFETIYQWCLLKALPSPWWACSAREPTLPEASGLRAPLCSRRSLQCHSRLHVVTGLARSDFVPPHSHVHLQNGRQQDGQCGLFAAVGNRRCEWHRSYEAPAAQAATRQRNASRNSSRRNVAPLAGCPSLPLVQGVLPMVSEYTCAHVRYVSNDELARRAARCMPGGDMYEP